MCSTFKHQETNFIEKLWKTYYVDIIVTTKFCFIQLCTVHLSHKHRTEKKSCAAAIFQILYIHLESSHICGSNRKQKGKRTFYHCHFLFERLLMVLREIFLLLIYFLNLFDDSLLFHYIFNDITYNTLFF